MRISRRHLITAAGAIALSAPIPSWPSVACESGALVIVRTDRGIRALDPRTQSVMPWNGPLPAATPPAATTPATVPVAVATAVTEGAVGYWMSSPDDDAWIFWLDTGTSSSWWWVRDGGRAVRLDLPTDLEPAFPGGTSARWFHGATVDSSHLGAGTLRLLAVDLSIGTIVLDHALDRRLELAATAVSDGGAIVAHVQPSTTGVAFWAADLRDGTRRFDADVLTKPEVAAASAIVLKVVADGDAVVAAAGVIRDAPGAPGPMVYAIHAAADDDVVTLSLPGELIGIVRRP